MGGIRLDAGMCPSALLTRHEKDMVTTIEENSLRVQ